MLTGEMELWHGLVIAAGSLLLQACLLIAVSYLLSRQIAHHSDRILKEARLQARGLSSVHHHSPAAQKSKETWTGGGTSVSAPHYRPSGLFQKRNSFSLSPDESDTSSDSSDSSDISPPACQATKDMNYTQVVFSAPGGPISESALDYENMKEATDYVNVNLKTQKPNFWTFVNPAVSESVEYTQVAV